MPDITPVPDDSSRLKTVLIVSAVVVLICGAVAFVFWRSLRPADERTQARRGYEAAQETTADVIPGGRDTTASAVGSRSAGVATSSGEPSQTSVPAASSDEIVFRLGGSLYLAKADGSSPRSLGFSAQGAYALSPDGSTVAVVDGGILTFIDAASGSRIRAGRARDVTPIWRPDSSGVVYGRHEGTAGGVKEMWSVKRDGTGDRLLAAGIDAAISPDGATVVLLPDPEVSGGQVQIMRAGRATRKIALAGVPTAVAVTSTRVLVGMVGANDAAAVYSFSLDGGGARKLLSGPTVDMRANWGSFLLSRDGSRLALAAVGDDGFSRLSVMTIATGAEVRLNVRRDAYPSSWSRDSKRLYFVEGSAYQGESTSLVSVDVDGSDRHVVVTGASL